MTSHDQARIDDLFRSFFKIGLFTFGGGFAMIPIIQREVVVRNRWVDERDFIDLLTIAQSAPGPIALNSAAFVGYKSRGYAGALASVGGVILPSFVIILVVAIFFTTIRDNAIVDAAFKAMRPVVVALILQPTITLTKGMHPLMIGVLVASLVLFVVFELSPLYLIVVAAVAAVAWTRRIEHKINKK